MKKVNARQKTRLSKKSKVARSSGDRSTIPERSIVVNKITGYEIKSLEKELGEPK